MTSKQKDLILFFPLLALTILFITIILIANPYSNNGIYDVSKDAVYIAGEACTINMHQDRHIHSITDDMYACVELHLNYFPPEE